MGGAREEAVTVQDFLAWREANGLSQLAAAKHLETTVRTVSRWETRVVPIPKWVKVWIKQEGNNGQKVEA